MTVAKVCNFKAKFQAGEISGFGYATGTDATGADAHALVGLTVEHPNALQVRIPAPPRHIVSVSDPVPVDRAFVADFAACHEGISLL